MNIYTNRRNSMTKSPPSHSYHLPTSPATSCDSEGDAPLSPPATPSDCFQYSRSSPALVAPIVYRPLASSYPPQRGFSYMPEAKTQHGHPQQNRWLASNNTSAFRHQPTINDASNYHYYQQPYTHGMRTQSATYGCPIEIN
ncbi:hypothetical protein BDF14DRAFT_389426 [Spinellus fusiger]|nr:hypothetical protein BDF14DRAFT_389426 [Spinellus fusiger]